MKFPKLKNALFCRITSYVTIIGATVIPYILISHINFLPNIVDALLIVSIWTVLIIYIVRNLMALMTLDITLAICHCYNTARTQFDLPKSFSVKKVTKRISRFGKGYSPISIYCPPTSLRYKFNHPMSLYTQGIEKILLITRIFWMKGSI